jgi:hypothetical protein
VTFGDLYRIIFSKAQACEYVFIKASIREIVNRSYLYKDQFVEAKNMPQNELPVALLEIALHDESKKPKAKKTKKNDTRTFYSAKK